MAARIQIFNGRKAGKKTKGKKQSHENAGGLNFLFNGRSNMSKSKKKKGKRNTSHPHPKQKGKRNTHHAPHRHNVGHREGMLGAVIEGGGGALAAGLGSHLIAENFLTAWNSGAMAYLITAGIGSAISFVGGKFFGKRVLFGGLAGTALAVGYRIVEDMGATPAKAVSADVRDAQATAASSGAPAGSMGRMGDPGRRRLGTVVNFPFNVPQTYQVVNGQLVPVNAGQQALPPAPAGGGSSYAGQAGLRGPRTIDRRLRY